jgi:four helix bundle protein
MATIERFEDLEIWKKARELCKLIYTYTKKELFSRDFKLVAQIRSSCGSIMDNVAEGFERGGNNEFSQFIWIAKGSSGEVRSQLYRALDNNYITQEEFLQAYNLSSEISSMSKNLIDYLSSSEIKGTKFKKKDNK